MLPYITNHYPREFGVMVFYNEVYNTETWIGPNTPFVVKVSVFAEDGKLVESVGRIKKYNSASIVPVFQTLDIASLSSGNYLLCEEIKDKNNNTITTRYLKFTRSFDAVETNSEDFQLDGTFVSQFTNADSLYEIIRCHLPISTTLERTSIDNVLLLKDMDQLKSFLFTFWQTRNPANPESEWKQYMEKVAYTDKSFGNKIKRGWQTDRGRVYLQYGKPNTRIERHYNPDYYPFEIWHYYETNGLHNCKFLFVNPSMSNDFELIHTDNLPMEIR